MLGDEVKENVVTTNGLLKSIGFFSGVMQMFWNQTVITITQRWNILKITELYTFKWQIFPLHLEFYFFPFIYRDTIDI